MVICADLVFVVVVAVVPSVTCPAALGSRENNKLR
jgi:hypothetical protein